MIRFSKHTIISLTAWVRTMISVAQEKLFTHIEKIPDTIQEYAFEMKVSEEDFWKRFDRNSERYWLSLYYPLLHTQRELPSEEPIEMLRTHYMFWINHMIKEFMDDMYIYSLNLQAGYFS